MAYILEKIGNTYNLPKKYFTCDAKSDLDGISLVDVPIGSEAYCILEEESYILDSNKQWHKKKIGEDLTGYVTETELTSKGYLTSYTETDPTVPEWAKQPAKPTYTAEEVGAMPDTYIPPNQTAEQVGADPKGAAASAVSQHNTDTVAHNDLRIALQGLSDRINAALDSDDTTLDQMSEVVAYIKSNKSLIDAITTSKVSVVDIVDNLTTNVSNKPLSAAQGVVIKTLIDALRNDKLDTAELTNAINTALAQAKASGEFDGPAGSKGDTGATGAAGQSAYDAAKSGGYTDTQANFYADLAAMQGLASALAAI